MAPFFNVSWKPRSGIKVKFAKLYSGSSAAAIDALISAVQISGAGATYTQQLSTNAGSVAVVGAGWKATLVYVTAAGVTVAVTVHHVDLTIAVWTLASALVGLVTDPTGNATTALVEIRIADEIYV